MEEQIPGMQANFYLFEILLVSWWSDSQHGFALPTEGYVAILLGVPVALVVPLSNRLDKCWYSIRASFYSVPEKQARCGGGFQNPLLVLVRIIVSMNEGSQI